MTKGLQSEELRDLNRLLKRLLNNVYTFALIKERYFFKSAMEEYERLQRVELHTSQGLSIETMDPADQVSMINHESVEQLNKLHDDFYRNFIAFKENLEGREEQNFTYLRFRLDFNMYYQNRHAQELGNDSSDGEDMMDDEGNIRADEEEDLADEDDDEDEDDEDEDLAEDPDDDDDDMQ